MFSINFILNLKILKKINFKILKPILKIFPFALLRIQGFNTLFHFKKKYILLYLYILKYNSSFLFNYLTDIAVIDYP